MIYCYFVQKNYFCNAVFLDFHTHRAKKQNMDKIELSVVGISYSQTQTGAYALVLEEVDGEYRLPIIIGVAEAQAIAIEKEGLKLVRPLTYDLLVNLASSFAISVIEVNIINFNDGIFYSELVCERGNSIVKIDSRPSDAIALALKFKCPIYITPEILYEKGIRFPSAKGSSDDKPIETNSPVKLGKKTIIQLNKMLEEAIQNEDYELAASIKKELNKRKKK